MKTEQIRLVLAIAREKSINKAAASLYLSQPTASSMLKALEAELGYPLFRRTRTGMLLTEEGCEFLEYAGAINRSLQAISQIRQPVKRIDFHVLSLRFDFSELAFERICEKYCSGTNAVDFSFQVVGDTEEAIRMIERGSGDAAVVICRENLYESNVRSAVRQHLETALIGKSRLQMTCRRGHPILQGGGIALDLLGRYPCFTSIHTSSSEMYAPHLLTKYGIELQSSISLEPSAVRYRLLRKTDGFLISMPISDEIKAEYDFESVSIPDSDIALFAIYRRDPQKDGFIREYLELCKAPAL